MANRLLRGAGIKDGQTYPRYSIIGDGSLVAPKRIRMIPENNTQYAIVFVSTAFAYVIDVSDPSNISTVTTVVNPVLPNGQGAFSSVYGNPSVRGNHCVLGYSSVSKFIVLDVSDPTAITQKALVEDVTYLSAGVKVTLLSENRLVTISGGAYIALWDISTGTPSRLDVVGLSGSFYGIPYNDRYILVFNDSSNGLTVYDTNGDSLTQIYNSTLAQWENNRRIGVEIGSNKLLTFQGGPSRSSDEAWVIDMSTPSSPVKDQIITASAASDVDDIAIVNNKVVTLSDSADKLQTWSIFNPSSVSYLREQGGFAIGLSFADGIVHTSGETVVVTEDPNDRVTALSRL